MQYSRSSYKNLDLFLMLFIFLMLFLLPVVFTRVSGALVWKSVLKIWQDRILLVPLFALNHWLLVPKLMLKKRYPTYLLAIFSCITLLTVSYYFYDRPGPVRVNTPIPERKLPEKPGNGGPKLMRDEPRPQPVPPYADLLLFSLLIVSVDTGLSFTKQWHSAEEEKVKLEKENIESQLGMLRNQISPHFLMNTLNNIYSLIDSDKERSKQAVMRLSKLMRYLLYENADGKILLSREFEFLKSYVDLMKIRYVDDIEITLRFPEIYEDVKIPVLLFISFFENAFKFGTSYQQKSSIEAYFEISEHDLVFRCMNNKNVFTGNISGGGVGLRNTRQRLDLLYRDNYHLDVNETEETYTVELKIPIR